MARAAVPPTRRGLRCFAPSTTRTPDSRSPPFPTHLRAMEIEAGFPTVSVTLSGVAVGFPILVGRLILREEHRISRPCSPLDRLLIFDLEPSRLGGGGSGPGEHEGWECGAPVLACSTTALARRHRLRVTPATESL